MDPIERINVRGDSSFALLLDAQTRGHRLAYYTPDRLALRQNDVFATVRSLAVRDTEGSPFHPGRGEKRVDLKSFDVILMRQDPALRPRLYLGHPSARAPSARNAGGQRPGHVRNAPEKVFVTEFPDLMPPTLITRDLAEIKAFRAEHGDIVMKPLYGNGGAAVFRLAPEDVNFGSLYDLFAVTFREPWVVQKYLPAVKQGDKRIILVDGEFAGAVNRVPRPTICAPTWCGRGGGSDQLTAREREICARLGPRLRERGLLFTGIDVIDGYLTEINVTSPTGIRGSSGWADPISRR